MFIKIAAARFFAACREKRAAIAAGIFWETAGILLFLTKGMALYRNLGLCTCAADCYVMAGMVGKRLTAGIPVYLFLTVLMRQDSGNVPYILYLGKRRNIWKGQCLERLFSAVLLTIWELIAVGAYGILCTGSLLNWEQEGSVFWDAAGRTITGLSFWKIAAGFGTVTLLIYFFTGILVSFVEMLSGSIAAGICVCLALAFAENFSKLSVFYDRATVFYGQWIARRLWGDWLWSAFLILALLAGGGWVAGRKEFYGT